MTANLKLKVVIQEADFNVAQLQSELLFPDAAEGACATFTGYVRGENLQRDVHSMSLEHYPQMTENSIHSILQRAAKRWPLYAASVVHRVGKLHPGEQIVWVGVTSSHREAAFAACEFVMDYLKSEAPLWKKELGSQGGHWVDARDSDRARLKRWGEDSKQ